jgi:hypothetical protein
MARHPAGRCILDGLRVSYSRGLPRQADAASASNHFAFKIEIANHPNRFQL